MKTQWAKALEVLESVPEENRLRYDWYDEGRYCAVTALALASKPELEEEFNQDSYTIDHAITEARTIVRTVYGLSTYWIIDVLDARGGGWPELLERLRRHDQLLEAV